MRVLVVGATGRLGRPVVARLLADGLAVRALVRDPVKARAMLPRACELAAGDVVEDPSSLDAAMQGAEAVYVNLAAPRSERHRDVERLGTPRICEAARRAGVRRLSKISFMGVPEAAGLWWQVRHKAESEQAVRESGLEWTIFRPTWFVEALALFRIAGRRLVVPRVPGEPIWWIAAHDYAWQVSVALRSPRGARRTFVVQGPQGVPFAEAVRRFAGACDPPLRVTSLPGEVLRALAFVSADARYLRDLFAVTFATNTTLAAGDTWDELGPPTMTIEEAARRLPVATAAL